MRALVFLKNINFDTRVFGDGHGNAVCCTVVVKVETSYVRAKNIINDRY